jgi:hypothetical protein
MISGIPVQGMSGFMEENAHAVSVRKPKRIGDISSTVRHWMQATTETWQKVKKAMQIWKLPAYFWTDIKKGLHHLPSDLNESTSPTLPFQISVNPIRNHLWAAFQEQNSIKWTNLLKGRMSHSWQQFATAHIRSKKLDLQAQKWGPKFITALREHSLPIWNFRNDAFHGDANTQVKRYKLEELERGKTQIRKRYIELQPI